MLCGLENYLWGLRNKLLKRLILKYHKSQGLYYID
jgi:hypothetical protein